MQCRVISRVWGVIGWNGRSRSCDYKDQAIRVCVCVCVYVRVRVCVFVRATSGPVAALLEECSVDLQILCLAT